MVFNNLGQIKGLLIGTLLIGVIIYSFTYFGTLQTLLRSNSYHPDSNIHPNSLLTNILNHNITDTPPTEPIPQEEPTETIAVPPATQFPPRLTEVNFTTATKQVALPSDVEAIEVMANYTKRHNDFMQGRTTDARILVWQVGGGWGFGNRFLGLLSLMLVALAEDRLIFVDDDYALAHAINWPFEWQWSKVKDKLPTVYQTPVKTDFIDGCFFLTSDGVQFDSINFTTLFPNVSHVFRTNCPIFHWAGKNPHYLTKYKELHLLPKSEIPVEHYGFYAASSIGKIFFSTMKSDVQQKAADYLQQWKYTNGKRNLLVGLQMRVGGNGDAGFLRTNEMETFWSCLNQLTQNVEFKVLIVTDHPFVIDKARVQFGHEKVVSTEGRAVHIAQSAPSDDDMKKILLDFYLLGECDEIIITPQSTFGASGILRTGKVPFYVYESQCNEGTPEYGSGGRLANSIIWK